VQVKAFPTPGALGAAAALEAAAAIRDAVTRSGRARCIFATGASQFEFLEALVASPDVPWGAIEFFHLDEYVGLAASHPASFRRYLQERVLDKVSPAAVHLLDGEGDVYGVCDAVGAAISEAPVDVAFVGIGENGHLAFNDPPADFETEAPYIVVDLDEDCRRQQVGEGWFESVDDVPAQAISMSIRQILAATRIQCVVPNARKAEAVARCLEGPVTPMAPASILQEHPDVTVYLDEASAERLSGTVAVERPGGDGRP
jgi:glucosamine-6-phosphate deaminase